MPLVDGRGCSVMGCRNNRQLSPLKSVVLSRKVVKPAFVLRLKWHTPHLYGGLECMYVLVHVRSDRLCRSN